MRAEAIGELLGGRLLMLRFLDEVNYLLQRTFRCRPKHQRLDRPPQIDRTGKDRVAQALFNRIGFTS